MTKGNDFLIEKEIDLLMQITAVREMVHTEANIVLEIFADFLTVDNVIYEEMDHFRMCGIGGQILVVEMVLAEVEVTSDQVKEKAGKQAYLDAIYLYYLNHFWRVVDKHHFLRNIQQTCLRHYYNHRQHLYGSNAKMGKKYLTMS